jgi:hypothetical protein
MTLHNIATNTVATDRERHWSEVLLEVGAATAACVIMLAVLAAAVVGFTALLG